MKFLEALLPLGNVAASWLISPVDSTIAGEIAIGDMDVTCGL
jgi:hypothetical protein